MGLAGVPNTQDPCPRCGSTTMHSPGSPFCEQNICPECKGEWCSGATDDTMLRGKGEPCQTYYDGCHCCGTCAGFPKCPHGKWNIEDCEGCDSSDI